MVSIFVCQNLTIKYSAKSWVLQILITVFPYLPLSYPLSPREKGSLQPIKEIQLFLSLALTFKRLSTFVWT